MNHILDASCLHVTACIDSFGLPFLSFESELRRQLNSSLRCGPPSVTLTPKALTVTTMKFLFTLSLFVQTFK